MTQISPRDPLSPPPSDAEPWWKWLVYALAALAILCGIVLVLTWTTTPKTPEQRPPDLTFVEIDEIDTPEPEAPVDPEEGEETQEDLLAGEPDPEPEPEDEPEPEPEPEPPPKPDPKPEPEPKQPTTPDSTPKDLPEGDPKPLEEDERPLRVGLEEQSFNDNADNQDGPQFAVGDDARGGRPTTRSVDRDKTAVAGAAKDGTGTEAAQRPAARPSTRTRGQGGQSSRKASLAKNVPRDVPYPKMAKQRNVEATCTARIDINDKGEVERISNVQCTETGFGFEDALQKHIETQFRFEPEIENGEPKAVNIRWRHDFRIDY